MKNSTITIEYRFRSLLRSLKIALNSNNRKLAERAEKRLARMVNAQGVPFTLVLVFQSIIAKFQVGVLLEEIKASNPQAGFESWMEQWLFAGMDCAGPKKEDNRLLTLRLKKLDGTETVQKIPIKNCNVEIMGGLKMPFGEFIDNHVFPESVKVENTHVFEVVEFPVDSIEKQPNDENTIS